MIKNLDPKKMSKKPMAKHVYRGCKLHEIKADEDKLPPLGIKSVLIHAGTNDIPAMDDPKNLALDLDELGSSLQDRKNCEVIVSGIIHRKDAEFENNITTANAKIKESLSEERMAFRRQ